MVAHESKEMLPIVRLPTNVHYSDIDIDDPLLMDRFDAAEVLPQPRDLPTSISEDNTKSRKKHEM